MKATRVPPQTKATGLGSTPLRASSSANPFSALGMGIQVSSHPRDQRIRRFGRSKALNSGSRSLPKPAKCLSTSKLSPQMAALLVVPVYRVSIRSASTQAKTSACKAVVPTGRGSETKEMGSQCPSAALFHITIPAPARLVPSQSREAPSKVTLTGVPAVGKIICGCVLTQVTAWRDRELRVTRVVK